VIVHQDEGIANGQLVKFCEYERVPLEMRDLAQVQLFFRGRRVSGSHHQERRVFMRLEPVRYAASDPEDLS
jgi:hypothetical protein